MKELFKEVKSGTWKLEPWLDMKSVSKEMVDIFYDLIDKGYSRDQVYYIITEGFKTIDTFDSIYQLGREKTRATIEKLVHGDENKMEIVDGKL